MNRCLRSILKYFQFAFVIIPIDLSLSQSRNAVVDLGVPIQSPNRISYKTARAFGESKTDLLCWTTSAESGGHFIAMNLTTQKIFVHPLSHREAYPILFGSDGKVYVGSTSGYIMVWNPVGDTWKEAGARVFGVPNSSLNHVRVLCEGRDGWLYAGSCYGERARLQIKTGRVEKLPRIPEEGNWYVSAAATLPDGRIAFGLGYKARVYIYDPLQRKDVAQWMPAEYQKDGFCFNVISGKNIVYATHFPSGHRLSFDAASGAFLGKIPWPDYHLEDPWSKWIHSSGYGSAVDFYVDPKNDVAITFDGKSIFQFHPRDISLTTEVDPKRFVVSSDIDLALQYEVTNDCRILKYDHAHSKVEAVYEPKIPSVERNIYSLGVGPDKCIYGCAYQSTLLFRYNPKDKTLKVLGDHHPGWSGETYSYTIRGDELICASYTNGAVVAYKPLQNWDCTPTREINPHPLGFLGQQVYRPYEICCDGKGNLWAVGPAGWGTSGGGLARLSYLTNEIRSHSFTEVPHGVISIAPTTLVICSDTLIRWWDTENDSLIAQIALPFHTTSLCQIAGRSDSVMILATQNSLKIVDLYSAGHMKILGEYKTSIPISRIISEGNYAIIGGQKGIGVFDPKLYKYRHLTDEPLSNGFAFAVLDSMVYFTREGHLLSVKILYP